LRRLGKALADDATSMRHSALAASAPNGLVGSYIPSVYQRLLVQLAPMDPASIKDFDPARPLVIHGKDFNGGGWMYARGFQLRLSDSKANLCEKGNFIYAKSTGVHSFVMTLIRLKSVPVDGLELRLVGMSCPNRSRPTRRSGLR
jgi:hypothetical protein